MNEIVDKKNWDEAFSSVQSFFDSTIGETIENQRFCKFGGELTSRRKKIALGQDTYELRVESVTDIEGNSYHERWLKNGNLHRDGNLPAETVHQYHAIPSETYLDLAMQRFYLDGKLQSEIDTTYEDIVSSKPLSVRQHFGYDLSEENS